jgi:hypothetical protein
MPGGHLYSPAVLPLRMCTNSSCGVLRSATEEKQDKSTTLDAVIDDGAAHADTSDQCHFEFLLLCLAAVQMIERALCRVLRKDTFESCSDTVELLQGQACAIRQLIR